MHAQLLFSSDDDTVKVKKSVKGIVKWAIALGGRVPAGTVTGIEKQG